MIQLFLNDREVDLTESVGLYLNKKFESLENPTKYFSDYSKTITLPMTSKNKIIFDNYSRQDSVVSFNTLDPRKKIPFKLLYNSKLVLEGYCKVNNSNTIITDNCFQCELYSSFGLIMNELSELTFNKYECQSEGGDKDDKYLIQTPWSENLLVDRTLVKDSFEQESHSISGTDILDYLKFVPSYQGKYADFSSDKEQLLTGLSRDFDEMTQERDEHYKREFRSYYQQPAIWVDKLWKMAKDKVEEITDYSFNLDTSWFNLNNPYYTDLIYTCPNLYSRDDNFSEKNMNFGSNDLNYIVNITTMANLSSHHSKKTYYSPNGVLYNGGTFNQDRLGATEFNAKTSLMFLAHHPHPGFSATYGKIRKSNPLYIKFQAVNALTNQPINNASYIYMLYSCSVNDDISSNSYNEKIDVGITYEMDPGISDSEFPTGYAYNDGYWWKADVDLKLTVIDNVPYYITCDAYFANNSKAVEYAALSFLPRWDWMWTDFFWSTPFHDSPEGYTIFNNLQSASVKTLDYLRSRSEIDIYRIFPKDTTLLKVLLNYSKMFGLLWDVNQDEKTITVMTRNRFFNGYEIYDWTDKVDRQHDFILEPVCFNKKYVNFNVEEGKGERYEKYKSKYLNGYGSYKIDTDYQFNNDTEDLFEGIQPAMVCQKKQFSFMTNTEYPDRANFMGYNYKIKPTEHYLENDNEGSNAGNAGAFYFCNGTMDIDERLGLVSTSGYGVVIVSDDTEKMITTGEYCWNSCGENSVLASKLPDISTIDKEGKLSVHFASPKEYYFDTNTNNTKYVYESFWKNFIDERYSIQNKKLTGYFYLSPEEYGDIKFREFIKLDNILYHINRIFDYDFDTNSPTKVELVQIWDLNAYTDGQKAFSDFTVVPDKLEVYFHEYMPVEVYSTSEWSVYQKPTWISYYINNNRLYLKGNSDPLRPRTGFVVLRNNDNMEQVVEVWQEPQNKYLILNPQSATVKFAGDTIRVAIESRPDTVSVLSKPSWCSVFFLPRLATSNITTVRRIDGGFFYVEDLRNRIDSTNRMKIVNVETMTAVIMVNQNNSCFERTGIIRFTNGYVSKNFLIRQLGGAVIDIHHDETILDIDIGDIGTLDFRTPNQIDITSVGISSLGSFVAPNQDVDEIYMTFSPSLDTVDHGDGTPETSSGGQVVMQTLDGRTIAQNYNYGYVLRSYNVIVESREGGSVNVNNINYSTTFYEMMNNSVSFVIEAIPNDGYEFVCWSDGDTNVSRTLTVNGADIILYPIFEGGYYLYDNSNIVDFDDDSHVKI